jgi:hypothetical protein
MEKTELVFDLAHGSYSLGKPHHEVRLAELGEDMIEFVGLNPGCTQKQIFEGVTGKTEEKWKAFASVRRRLTQSATGRRGDPYRFTIDTE